MARVVVGVDGCAGAWLAVMQQMGSPSLEAQLHPDPASLVRQYPDDALICVDVPIGLTAKGPRLCDREARRLLGWPRQSSVFPPPIRPALAAMTREEASEVGRKADGRGVGAQAWGIFPYIRLWDDLLNARPDLRLRVMEVHPELSFYAMSGGKAMRFSKKKFEGAEERRLLLQSAFGGDRIAAAKESLGKARFGLDDLYDALAALWTAVRVAESRCECVPASPAPVDSCGLSMVIRF